MIDKYIIKLISICLFISLTNSTIITEGYYFLILFIIEIYIKII